MYPPEQLKQRLQKSKAPSDYDRALEKAYGNLEEITKNYKESNGVELACKKGCSLCCYMRVDAKAHEVLSIASHVDAQFKANRKLTLINRLEAHEKKVRELSYREQMAQNIPCPLLEYGSCSVYEVRPFGCRRHQSTILQRCEYSYEHPEDLDYPGGHHHGLSIQSVQAEESFKVVYKSLGYDMIGYELGTALLEAMKNSKCSKRWRNKKKAFITAKTSE